LWILSFSQLVQVLIDIALCLICCSSISPKLRTMLITKMMTPMTMIRMTTRLMVSFLHFHWSNYWNI